MRVSSSSAIEGSKVLYAIGRIEAASSWHPEGGAPLQDNWREAILRDLMRKAEDVDADAIVSLAFETEPARRINETGVKMKRIIATGIAVKLSCAVAA